MKKKFRLLIALAIVLVVVAAAYFIVINVIPEPVEETPEEPTVYYELIPYTISQTARLEFSYPDGYSYALLIDEVINELGQETLVYSVEDKEQYAYDKQNLGTAAMMLTDLSVTTLVDEAPETLETYGLDNPQCTMTATPAEGVEGEPITLLLGNSAPVGNGYYGMVEGKPEVYMLQGHTGSYMMATDRGFRSLVITAYEDYTTEIDSIMVTENGEPLIGADKRSKEELEKLPAYSTVTVLTAPIEYPGDDTIVSDTLFAPLAAINAISVVEDGVENGPKYGITEDEGLVIEVGNVDGTSLKLSLSAPDESNYRYGIVDGIDSIYLFDSTLFDFVHVDLKSVVSKTIWVAPITEVAKIEMKLPEAEHEMTFEFYTDPDEELEDGEDPTELLRATLDGEEITDTNGRRLFAKVFSPTFYEFVEDSVKREKIDYSFVVTYNDGSTTTMKFAQINGRQYVPILDGEDMGCCVNINGLTDIGTAIEKVLDGYNLAQSE